MSCNVVALAASARDLKSTSLERTMIGVALVGIICAALLISCDKQLPPVPTQAVSLELVPEQTIVSSRGGTFLVLMKLVGSTGSARIGTYLRATGAAMVPLPGGVWCRSPNDVGADAADASGNENATPADLIVFSSDTMSIHGDLQGGATVTIPPGDEDATVVGAVYEATDGQCPVTGTKLLAFASAHIVRKHGGMDAIVTDAGRDSMSSGSEQKAEAGNQASDEGIDSTTDSRLADGASND